MTSTLSSPDRATTRPVDLPDNAGRAAMGIAIVLTAQLMFILDATVVNVALPKIDTDLGFGPASLSWVLSAFTLAFGGLLLLGGRLGDVFGRRRLFLGGVAVFTLASLLGGLAQTPEWLVGARALQGVGAAMAAPGVLALLTTSAPDEPARLRALALFGAVSSGGMSLGLLLGGAVTDLGSWRWTLFINVPIGLAILAMTRRYVDETPRRPGRFDIVGALSATGGAVALVWTLISVPEHGWTSARTILGFLRRRGPDRPAGGHRTPRGPPAAAARAPAGAGAGSVAWPRSAWSSAGSCRCSSSPCSSSRTSSASGRWPRGWRSCR